MYRSDFNKALRSNDYLHDQWGGKSFEIRFKKWFVGSEQMLLNINKILIWIISLNFPDQFGMLNDGLFVNRYRQILVFLLQQHNWINTSLEK